jgi:tripartite-type tricarboxylate transporter receptor subunit TctC
MGSTVEGRSAAMKFTRSRFALALAAVATLAVTPAAGQDAASWPSRPVRIIVPASAGGIADAVARLLGEGLAKRLGQPFVIDNIAGAASVIGTAAAAKAPPDGYTVLIGAIAPLGIVPHVRKTSYVVERDLAPVGVVATQPHLLLVNPEKMAARTLPEFVQLTKDNPGKYNYASSGAGQLNHLEMELLLLKTGTKMTHVPYKSSGDQATALVGGHVDAAVFGITAALPYIKGGTVRPIAVMTAERYPDLPDLPAVKELIPSFGGVSSWHGILVPAATPKAIVAKLNGAMADYLHSPEGIAQMKTLGAEAVGSTPEALDALIKFESALWAEVIKTANLTIQ